MKFIVLFVIGLIFIGRSLYVLFKISNGAEKFKGQSKPAYVLMFIGVLCVAIVPAWFLFFNEPSEKKLQNATPKITWSLTKSDIKDLNIQELEKLLFYFQSQCKGWTEYPTTIEKAEINIRKFKKSNYELYAQEVLGWYTEIELEIKIKNDAKFPTDLRMVPGHTLHYFIGGGKKPGILMIKEVSALFLGVPKAQINPSTNTFVSNEFFKIADELEKGK